MDKQCLQRSRLAQGLFMGSVFALSLLVMSVLGGLFLPSLAKADEAAEIAKSYFPNAQEVGRGRLTIFFLKIYDAVLYAPDGEWTKNPPYALSISYLRDLNGDDIAERSVQEIRGQGFRDEATLAVWNKNMQALFPDVDDTTTLTSVHTRQGHAIFYRNGVQIGEIHDPEFSHWFFGIWLNEATSEPELRRHLLGIRD